MEYYSMALYILIDNEIVTAKYTLKVENKTPVFQRNRPMSNENKNKKQFMKFGIRYWVNHNSFFLSYIYNIIQKKTPFQVPHFKGIHFIIGLYNTFYVLYNRVASIIIQFSFDEDAENVFFNKTFVNLFFLHALNLLNELNTHYALLNNRLYKKDMYLL